ncbi:MAG: sigma-70 family RNA polymerase sigma factor [Calditrichaeota bacterium]|nr:sigma-70 family RNA polymerase sigma factor [Calditrichota bacterium]
MKDETLLNHGRKEKFEEIALQYMDNLYTSALHFTRNVEEAEDLVQDTYLRAYRFFDKFEEGTNFKAWISRIMTNTFINGYRKKARTPQQVDLEKVEFFIKDDVTFNEPITENAYYENNYDKLFDDDVNRALDRLTESFRQILVLADVEGLSYKEIADKAGIPLGTVMSRLFRARRMLQKSLKKYAVSKGYLYDQSFA